MKAGVSIALIVIVMLALCGAGLYASDLHWPLPHAALAPLGLFLLSLVLAGWLCLTLVLMARGQSQQQRALRESQQAVQRQLEAAELTQLMSQFSRHAEALLDKESLDPNKRSVMRCLAVDALRGNTGRGDTTYTRLARLFEWLDAEAALQAQDPHRQRLMVPTLMQYAEIAGQLCRVGESRPEKLTHFLTHQPPAASREAE